MPDASLRENVSNVHAHGHPVSTQPQVETVPSQDFLPKLPNVLEHFFRIRCKILALYYVHLLTRNELLTGVLSTSCCVVYSVSHKNTPSED